MASEIKIHLRFNVETGKKDIMIEYDTDADALPFEHEARHREIVEELIGQGVIDPDDVGSIKVGRVEGEAAGTASGNEAPQAEPEAAGEG